MSLLCNRRELDSSLLHSNYADAHTQHNKKFNFSWPPLTSVTSEVEWKTSNFIVDFDVGKSKDFGVFLSESINFEYLRH